MITVDSREPHSRRAKLKTPASYRSPLMDRLPSADLIELVETGFIQRGAGQGIYPPPPQLESLPPTPLQNFGS